MDIPVSLLNWEVFLPERYKASAYAPQKLAPGAVGQTASANVMNLQKRVAGVLPVPIEVPRTGTSFSFVQPLLLDEETKVTFSYKSR